MKVRCLISLAVLFLGLLLSLGAEAALITDSGAFPNDGLTKTITFDGLQLGPVTDEYESVGVTFSGGAITFLAPDQVLNVDQGIEATFSVIVDMVGVSFSSDSELYIEAFDAAGSLIEIVDTTTLNNPLNGFFGVSAPGEVISSIIIHDHGFGFTIDNFTFHDPVGGNMAIPEPATLILLGSGLVCVGLYSRRRRHKD